MIKHEPLTFESGEFYQLHKNDQGGYSVIFEFTSLVDFCGDDWVCREPRQISEVIGTTTSREAALAVIRLHGGNEYEDWTNND